MLTPQPCQLGASLGARGGRTAQLLSPLAQGDTSSAAGLLPEAPPCSAWFSAASTAFPVPEEPEASALTSAAVPALARAGCHGKGGTKARDDPGAQRCQGTSCPAPQATDSRTHTPQTRPLLPTPLPPAPAQALLPLRRCRQTQHPKSLSEVLAYKLFISFSCYSSLAGHRPQQLLPRVRASKALLRGWAKGSASIWGAQGRKCSSAVKPCAEAPNPKAARISM